MHAHCTWLTLEHLLSLLFSAGKHLPSHHCSAEASSGDPCCYVLAFEKGTSSACLDVIQQVQIVLLAWYKREEGGVVSLKPVSEREPQSAWGLGNCPIVRTRGPTIFLANIPLLKSFVCQFLQTGKHAAYKTLSISSFPHLSLRLEREWMVWRVIREKDPRENGHLATKWKWMW